MTEAHLHEDEKRLDEKDIEPYAQSEANDWFKWLLIAYLGFPICALIFVIVPSYT